MKLLLKLKPWQMFTLLLLPFLFSGNSLLGKLFQIIWVIVYFGWIYTIGSISSTKVHIKHTKGKFYFKMSFIFIFVYFLILTFFFDGGYNINQNNFRHAENLLGIIIFLHFYLIWSCFYLFYFAAKMLKTIILDQVPDFAQISDIFFAFWFFPIGVWYIQPKLKAII